MDDSETRMHLRAGEAYGQDATCGPPGKPKIRYSSEASAIKAAVAMTEKHGRDLEGYPCFWCSRWHVGRMMTPEERKRFS